MTLPSDLLFMRFEDGTWELYEPNADPSRDTPLAVGNSSREPRTGEYHRPDFNDYGKALETLSIRERARLMAPRTITASWTEAGIIYHAMSDGRVWRWFAGEWHCDTTPLPESAWRADAATGGAL